MNDKNRAAAVPTTLVKQTSVLQVFVLAAAILLTMLPVTIPVTGLKEIVIDRFSTARYWLSAFMSISLFGAILFAPLAAMLIDRTASRRMIIVPALIGNSICFMIMAIAPSLLIMMVARFFEGVMHITALSAMMAMGADLSTKKSAGRVMGALGGMIMLGVSIGVPIGSIIGRINIDYVLWASALVSLLAALVANFNRPANRVDISTGTLLTLFETIRKNKRLFLPYAYTFIDRLCVGVVVTTFTLYLVDILGLSISSRGQYLSAFLIPFALLCYPVGRISDRVGRGWLMAAGSFLFGVTFMIYGFVDVHWLLVLMLASGVFSAVMFAPSLAICKDLAPADHHGSAFAGFNVAGSLGFALGPVLGVAMFSYFHLYLDELSAYQWTFIAIGSFEILCALISLPFLVRMMRAGVLK